MAARTNTMSYGQTSTTTAMEPAHTGKGEVRLSARSILEERTSHNQASSRLAKIEGSSIPSKGVLGPMPTDWPLS